MVLSFLRIAVRDLDDRHDGLLGFARLPALAAPTGAREFRLECLPTDSWAGYVLAPLRDFRHGERGAMLRDEIQRSDTFHILAVQAWIPEKLIQRWCLSNDLPRDDLQMSGTLCAQATRAGGSGHDAAARFRQAAVATLAFLKIEQGLVELGAAEIRP